MKRIVNYFSRDMGVMFGRSMRHMFRGMHTRVTVIPVAVMLLLVYMLGGVMLALEEMFNWKSFTGT